MASAMGIAELIEELKFEATRFGRVGYKKAALFEAANALGDMQRRVEELRLEIKKMRDLHRRALEETGELLARTIRAETAISEIINKRA